MDVFQTESTGRTPDAGLSPEKMFEGRDLHEKHSVSVINDGDTIKNFCSKYNVYEKHVITYINRIDIRKDIRGTKEARGAPDIHGLQMGLHPY